MGKTSFYFGSDLQTFSFRPHLVHVTFNYICTGPLVNEPNWLKKKKKKICSWIFCSYIWDGLRHTAHDFFRFQLDYDQSVSSNTDSYWHPIVFYPYLWHTKFRKIKWWQIERHHWWLRSGENPKLLNTLIDFHESWRLELTLLVVFLLTQWTRSHKNESEIRSSWNFLKNHDKSWK